MKISEVAEILTNDGMWLVRKTSNEIRLVRSFGKKVITVRLRKTLRKKYELIFPSYLFNSSISHFSPVGDEMRFCRNKAVIKSLLKFLKRTSIWNEIDNRDFLRINSDNKKSHKIKLSKELSEMLGE